MSEEESKTISLSVFSAKYPYLELRNHSGKKEEDQRNPVLDFGSVAIGQSLCKNFDIFNPSPVSNIHTHTNINAHL